MRARQAAYAVVVLLLPLGIIPISTAQTRAQTADHPDAWLVVYNLASPDSVTWALWYAKQHGIPGENLLGVTAALTEHLPDLATARTQVFNPVRDYLAQNPQIEGRILGILAGYGVPGHYGTVPLGGPGGYSIANGLQDLNNDSKEINNNNPEILGYFPPRLTKPDLPAGHYMVGRIDAPTLEAAKDLTRRAQVLASPTTYIHADYFWCDYYDSILPNGQWYWLWQAVNSGLFPEIPWREFDDDTQQTPWDAFRFGAHDVKNWNNSRLYGEPRGVRILAYNLNSWGATTVRDLFADGGRYVPNALNAGYAAAIGSTGEPGSVIGPFPWVLLAALREGWTLGEAMYLANPYDDWVWICVGDPLLRVAHWFDEAPDGGPTEPDPRDRLNDKGR